MLEFLIKTYTDEGQVVLDPTMGSGSTGVACINTGRRFIGFELDPHWFEVSEQRIQKAINDKQATLLTEFDNAMAAAAPTAATAATGTDDIIAPLN